MAKRRGTSQGDGPLTLLRTPVWRETRAMVRDNGRTRPLVAGLTHDGLAVRLKGCRFQLTLPYEAAYSAAAKMAAEQRRRERKVERAT